MGNWWKRVLLGSNDLGTDAWGRAKTVQDFSLFSALWTFSVPNRVWEQWNDTGAGYVEQPQIDNTLVKSTHGHLYVNGTNTTDVMLTSKRHPRYQPNRGFLYSSAEILPIPEMVGTRRFGSAVDGESGIFFELVGDGANWVMNIVRRTTLSGVTTDYRVDITSELPSGFDPSKGHTYDIQMQWRGVGNIKVFVDLQLVYTFELLGTLTDLSVNNPALQVMFEVTGVTGLDDCAIVAGCVDITTEGGARANKLYTSVNTGTSLLPTSTAGNAVLAVKMPHTVAYDGSTMKYTRDMIMTEMSTFCKDEAFRVVSYGRLLSCPNLDAAVGWVTAPDSLYQYLDNTTGALNTAYQLDKANMQQIYSIRSEKDISKSHKNPDPDNADFYITAGDIIVIELKSDGASTGGCTLEFAEEL